MKKRSERAKKYDAYIASDEWKELKLDILMQRGCNCERCLKSLPPNVLQLHHKTYARLFKELASDLELLCPNCHRKEHGIKTTVKSKKTAVKKKVKNKKTISRKYVKLTEAKIRSGQYKTEASKLAAMKRAFKRDGNKL